MTEQQKQLVRETFPLIREIAGPVAQLFYGRLFELAPAVRPLFQRDIQVQGRKLMDMLTVLVDSLDDFDTTAPELRALGQRHAGYGVLSQHYEVLTTALLWAFCHALERDFIPEVRAAWLTLIEDINAVMKAGAAELPPV
jgi:hemoglobin-like flavoprotein